MKTMDQKEFARENVFGLGAENTAYAKYFIGQMLICTAGEGWYQEEGKAPVSLTAGTVITIPPEVKHWHGAKKDSWFSHIAVEVPGEDTSNEWCDPVPEKEYCELEER